MLPVFLGKNPAGPLRFLCLGAHSDDIEIGCGGTLLRLLSEHPGSTVDWVVFTADGSRAREARESAAVFTAEAGQANVVIHAFRESYFPDERTQIKDCFEALKRSVTPDIVFAHHRHDAHQDHRTIAELVWNTFRNHVVLEYEIPKYEGDLGSPALYVPLTRVQAEQKVALLLKYFASQATRTWFRPEVFLGVMSLRGIECNAPEGFAEAFHLRKLVL